MKVFHGFCRKFSVLAVLLFFVGWIVYLVGFLKRMIKPTALLPRWDNYPSIIAAGVGPVFILTALLQSCLGGTASAFMGSLTAVASVIFLVSLGNSSITSAQTLYHFNSTAESTSTLYVSSTLVGSILCGLGITLLLSLWGFYKDTSEEQHGHIILHEDTDGEEMVSHHSSPADMVCKTTCFFGWARKVSVLCLLFSFLGWCVMVGGHYHRINSIPEESRYSNDLLTMDLGQWGASVLTPLLLLFALLQACLSGFSSSVVGVINSILNGIVLTSIGYYMVHDIGQWLKEECEHDCNYTLPQNAAALAEIVGSFMTCFFWSSVLGLWPFYRRYSGAGEEGMSRLSGYIQHRRSRDTPYLSQDNNESEI